METRLPRPFGVSLFARRLFDLDLSAFILTLTKRTASAVMTPFHDSQLAGYSHQTRTTAGIVVGLFSQFDTKSRKLYATH